MIRAALYGRLGRDPVERETRNGKRMVTGSLAVNAARFGEDERTEWYSLAAFGNLADALLRHRQGDLLAAMGTLQKTRFTGHDGVERDGWSLTVESIVSARTVRPAAARKRAAIDTSPDTRPTQQPNSDELNDEFGF